MTTWLYTVWIVVNSGAVSTVMVTEQQCMAQIEFLSVQPNMLMEASCTSPNGLLVHTVPIGQRKPATAEMQRPKPSARDM